MNISVSQVSSDSDINAVVSLAGEIWRQHFTAIIGPGQVEYMLEKFQSFSAVSDQIKSGAEYYLAADEDRHVAYTGLIPDRPAGRMMISKFYVRQDARCSGVGTRLLDFVESECGNRKLHTVWLTVNRFNAGPIEWYLRKDFSIVDEAKKDIGSGYYMDDFIMEKRIGAV